MRRSLTARGILLFLAVLGLTQLACVGGHIPPSIIQFHEVAQVEVAKAVDEAARIVLRERLPTALACTQFRKHLQSILTHPEFGTLPGQSHHKCLILMAWPGQARSVSRDRR